MASSQQRVLAQTNSSRNEDRSVDLKGISINGGILQQNRDDDGCGGDDGQQHGHRPIQTNHSAIYFNHTMISRQDEATLKKREAKNEDKQAQRQNILSNTLPPSSNNGGIVVNPSTSMNLG